MFFSRKIGGLVFDPLFILFIIIPPSDSFLPPPNPKKQPSMARTKQTTRKRDPQWRIARKAADEEESLDDGTFDPSQMSATISDRAKRKFGEKMGSTLCRVPKKSAPMIALPLPTPPIIDGDSFDLSAVSSQ